MSIKYEKDGEWLTVKNGTPISHLIPEDYVVCFLCDTVYHKNKCTYVIPYGSACAVCHKEYFE